MVLVMIEALTVGLRGAPVEYYSDLDQDRPALEDFQDSRLLQVTQTCAADKLNNV